MFDDFTRAASACKSLPRRAPSTSSGSFCGVHPKQGISQRCQLLRQAIVVRRDAAVRQSQQAPPIETAAVLSNGREVKDIVEFKAMLLEREPQVVHCLAEKMLTYATGRLVEAGDRGEVDRIVKELDAKGNRLRDLVHLVVQSDMFMNK